MARLSLKAGATMDMTTGPLLSKLIIYSLPIVISGLLQLLFNTADIAVVGRFTGSDALAAVSAAGPISNLIVTLFMGLSMGANVLCAQYAGAGDKQGLRETVHTSILLSLTTGIGMMLLGLACTDILLTAMGTPEDILPMARTYLWIYFLGVPGTMLYNFGAAILRAVGDTRRPMLFLMLSGALNFGLNLLFVAGFGMGVEGVATATVTAQYVSAVLIVIVMLRTREIYHLDIKSLKIHKDKLVGILKIGIPAGLQGTAFSVSNLLIQSSVNSLGAAVMAASAVAWSIDGFCYVGVDALGQAATSFTGQNFGAGNYQRIHKIFIYTNVLGVLILVVLGTAAWIFAPQIMSIYTTDPEVISVGSEILFIICAFGFVNSTMNIPFNIIRGMNHSMFSMFSTILCVCVMRVVWVYTVFEWVPTVTALFISYPVTKGLASITGMVYYHRLMKKEKPALSFKRKAQVS